jgi:hypothetical protein
VADMGSQPFDVAVGVTLEGLGHALSLHTVGWAGLDCTEMYRICHTPKKTLTASDATARMQPHWNGFPLPVLVCMGL